MNARIPRNIPPIHQQKACSSMDLTIRQATPGDLVAVLRFQQCIVGTERAFDPTIKDGSVHYYDIAALIASPDVHFLVAEYGSNLVGCGYARIEAAKHSL